MHGNRNLPHAVATEAVWPAVSAPRAPSSSQPLLYERIALLSGGWTASGVALYLIAPRAAPALLGLAVIAPLAWSWATQRQLPWHTPSAVHATLALAAVYLLINASWSLSRADAYATVAMFAAATLVLHITAIALPRTPPPALRAMAIGLLAGLSIAAGVLCFEVLSDQWLRRLLAGHFHGLRPDGRHMLLDGGQVAYLAPYLLNRSMTALGLTFWPALLLFEHLAVGIRQRALLMAGLFLTPVAILASHHGTSKLAFAGAAAIYGIGRLSLVLTKRVLITGWLVATLLVAPLAAIAYGNQLHLAHWLDYSVRHRIVIWEYSRSEIAKAPLLGAGINSIRAHHNPGVEGAPRAASADIPLGAPLHSHNAYLQVWHEAGAIGAGLLLVLGLLILRAIAAEPAALQHHFYATFAAGALLAASSFSIWAPSFLPALALTAVFACMGAAVAAPRAESSNG